ncbi:MAG: hypothetical protein JW947_09150 [Sedimentisphaerales bacterium]|nr:hypothetical protein [Sedimentisphaerales bacterium]
MFRSRGELIRSTILRVTILIFSGLFPTASVDAAGPPLSDVWGEHQEIPYEWNFGEGIVGGYEPSGWIDATGGTIHHGAFSSSYVVGLMGVDVKDGIHKSILVHETGWYDIQIKGRFSGKIYSTGGTAILPGVNEGVFNICLEADMLYGGEVLEESIGSYWPIYISDIVHDFIGNVAWGTAKTLLGSIKELKTLPSVITFFQFAEGVSEPVEEWDMPSNPFILTVSAFLQAETNYELDFHIYSQCASECIGLGGHISIVNFTVQIEDIAGLPQNNNPILSNPRVTPISGNTNTTFEFLVDYYDPDGDPPDPIYRKVYISGCGNQAEGIMTLKSGTAANGTYSYSRKLPVCSSYSYEFFFSDNKGVSDIIGWYNGPWVFTKNSSVELQVEVSGWSVTNNIEVRFGHGADLSHLEYTEWSAPELPQIVGVDSGEQLMFELNLDSDNHTFEKWVFRDDSGDIVRESTASGYGFTLLSGNIHATAYLSYTPLNYTISGTALKNNGSLVPGGVTLDLTSSVQTLSQTTTNGSFSFADVKGGVPVTIIPSASGGYEFIPPKRVYNNLKQNWPDQTFIAEMSDYYAPTTTFITVPPTITKNSAITFSWAGTDNVTVSANLQYQYKLDSVDADWSSWSSSTSKSYDVNNGAYTFWVRAKDEAGNINQAPASYKFVVNAAPKVVAAAKIKNSVWASRITLQMPLGATHPTNAFILLPEHSGMNDSELVPILIHHADDVNAVGANDIVASQLGLMVRITKAATGWLVTLPQAIPLGQTTQYDSVWGKIKYFGWQEEMPITKGFPNLTVGTGYSSFIGGSFLDDQLQMWRLAYKRLHRVNGVWGSTKLWIFMDVADRNGFVVNEQLQEYLLGIPDNGSYACDYDIGSTGQVFKLGNHICLIWSEEKYEKIGSGSNYEDRRYQRYVIRFLDAIGNTVNSYDGDWQEDTFIDSPSSTLSSGLCITGKTYNYTANTVELWFALHNASEGIKKSRTVFDSAPRANYGDIDLSYVRAMGDNIIFLFEKYHETSLGEDRREICYQVRDSLGNLVRSSTAINPPLLSDTIDKDDEYEFVSALTDGEGKVWISFEHYSEGTYENGYIIIGQDGNIWKTTTPVTGNIYFQFCDQDEYIWAQNSGNLLVFDNNDVQILPARPIAYMPNQNVGVQTAYREWQGNSYRLYDRWFPQPIQIDVPYGADANLMEIFDLDMWNNNLHPENLNLKKGDTLVWSQSGQFIGNTTIDLSGLLNYGQNLLTMVQNDFLGGQVLITFPYIVEHQLTISSGPGGSVTTPGEGSFTYEHGENVNVAATANVGYIFDNWTGTAVDAGKVLDPNAASTTVTIDANYTLQANFALDQKSLTTSATAGGTVTLPGIGTFWYNRGTEVDLIAQADSGYRFSIWTGSAVDAGKVANPLSSNTKVIIDDDYDVEAGFETSSIIEITKCTVFAGKGLNEDKDNITFSGSIGMTPANFSSASEVTVNIGGVYSETISVSSFIVKNGKYTYTYRIPKGQTGGIVSFIIDTNKKTFSLQVQKVNLTSLHCPFDVEIEVGNYWGRCEVDESVANGSKPIPIQLMTGVKNVLRVDKCTVKQGKKPSTDQLTVSGAFTVENPSMSMTDRISTGLVITLGTQTFTVPSGNLKPGKGKFSCTKASAAPSGVVVATFNFNMCSFTLTIKNTEITATGDVDFGVSFAGFDETDDITLP